MRGSDLLEAVRSFPADLRAGIAFDWAWLRRTTRSRATAACGDARVAAAGALVVCGAVAEVVAAPLSPATSLAGFVPETVAATTDPVGAPGSTLPGREGAEDSARLLTSSVGLPLAGDDWRIHLGHLAGTARDHCPPHRLEVSWTRPVGDFELGGHVEPLGPPPTMRTTRVNGIVTCRGSQYAYLGFEAAFEAGRWWLTPVPALVHEDDEELLPGEEDQVGATPLAADGAATGAGLPDASSWRDLAIEPLAPHVPQMTCDPTAKPGVLGFRDILLTTYPFTRNLGIGRMCDAPGASEHKEGRAFDWGVRVDVPAERAAADEVISWLLASDAAGNPYAIARRTGLMYVIWDGRIWSAERATEGWRSYVGVSEHRDHVHFSFSWAGARGETSFWTGDQRKRLRDNAPDLPLVLVPPPVIGVPVLPGLPLPPAAPAPQGPEAQAGEPPPSTTTTTARPAPAPSTSTSTTSTSTTTTAPRAAPVTSPPLPLVGDGGSTGLSTFGG
ncbi:MAG TPA: hypothetical protein VM345_16775 [Acidimicrobiales bacterium]|jgi:hypothetical protein|nr:hypothetical protein [Acidimicrobiales bacterium]